jgi:hypothetical protein
MLKKLLLSFLAANILLVTVATSFVHAANPPGPWYNQGLVDWYNKVYDENISPPEEIFGERYTAAQVDWIIYTLLTWVPTKILNPQITSCVLQLFLDGTFDVGGCIEGVIGSSDIPQPAQFVADKSQQKSLLASIFADRQLSGITYIKDIGRNFNLVPEAKAQVPGFGYTSALDPIRSMWFVSRNIAYALFVFIIIAMAFMVMFRVKLSPQTVVTVQSALPKIAIALVLVTFSYAIAGLLVDLMYVVIGIVSVLTSQIISNFINVTGVDVNPAWVFDLLTVGPQVGDRTFGIIGLFLIYMLMFSATFIIVGFTAIGWVGAALLGVVAAIGAVITSGGVVLVVGILAFVLSLILLIMLIWMAIKTLWTLAKAYVNIILLTILAPLQFTLGIIAPQYGFSAWVRSMLSNLAVFVAVGLLYVLAFLFLMGSVSQAFDPYNTNALGVLCNVLFGTVQCTASYANSPAGWPPLLQLGNTTGGAGTSLGTSILFMVISIVIFSMVPKAAELVKSMLGGKPVSYGSGIGESIAPVGFLGRSGIALTDQNVRTRFRNIQQYVQRTVGRPPETLETKNS